MIAKISSYMFLIPHAKQTFKFYFPKIFLLSVKKNLRSLKTMTFLFSAFKFLYKNQVKK